MSDTTTESDAHQFSKLKLKKPARPNHYNTTITGTQSLQIESNLSDADSSLSGFELKNRVQSKLLKHPDTSKALHQKTPEITPTMDSTLKWDERNTNLQSVFPPDEKYN